MNKKGSVLMISLWILAILVVFALSLGHRAMINLRLARYQRDRLKATYLAKAGLNRAIVELEKDKNESNYDSLSETWSTGIDPVTKKSLFENIGIGEGSGGTFTIKYLYDENNNTYLCMADEERKININRIDDFGQKQLSALLLFVGLVEPEIDELTNTIINWVDTDSEPIGELTEDAEFKNAPLKTPEELLLILEYYYQGERKEEKYQEKAQEIFSTIKNYITVYGESKKVNINTGEPKTLEILINACVTKLKDTGININANPINLLNKILEYRKGNPFLNINLEVVLDLSGPDESDFRTIINELKNLIDIQSQNFRIEAEGNVGQIKKKITAVVKRGNPGEPIKVVYWHEN